MLNAHPWDISVQELRSSSPHNYVVVDDFLRPGPCSDLRRELLSNRCWQTLDTSRLTGAQDAVYMRLERPQTHLVRLAAFEIRRVLPELLHGMVVVSHWALICTHNRGISLHADNAAMVVNIWLTPQRFNRDPSSGGLLLFDVKRDPHLHYEDFVSPHDASAYVRERARHAPIRIPYAYNRAVIFDGATFHQTDTIAFAGGAPERSRLNLSFAFDEPGAAVRRLA